MHIHINDPVRTHDQKIADLRKVDGGIHNSIHDEPPHQTEACDLEIRVLPEHL